MPYAWVFTVFSETYRSEAIERVACQGIQQPHLGRDHQEAGWRAAVQAGRQGRGGGGRIALGKLQAGQHHGFPARQRAAVVEALAQRGHRLGLRDPTP